MQKKDNNTFFVYSDHKVYNKTDALKDMEESFGARASSTLFGKIDDVSLLDEIKLFCSDDKRTEKFNQAINEGGFSKERGDVFEPFVRDHLNKHSYDGRYRLATDYEDKIKKMDLFDNENPDKIIQIKNSINIDQYKAWANELKDGSFKYPDGIWIPKDHSLKVLEKYPELEVRIHGDLDGIPIPNNEVFQSFLSDKLLEFLIQPYHELIEDIAKSELIALTITLIYVVYKNRRDIIDGNFHQFYKDTKKQLATVGGNVAAITTLKHALDIGLQSMDIQDFDPTLESAIAWMIIDTGKEVINVMNGNATISEAANRLKYNTLDLTVAFSVATLTTTITGGQVYIGYAAGAVAKIYMKKNREIIVQFFEGEIRINDILFPDGRDVHIYTADELVEMGYEAIYYIKTEYETIEYETIEYETINSKKTQGEINMKGLSIISHSDDMKSVQYLQNELVKKKTNAGFMSPKAYMKQESMAANQPKLIIGNPSKNEITKQFEWLPSHYKVDNNGEQLTIDRDDLFFAGIFRLLDIPFLAKKYLDRYRIWEKRIYIHGDWHEGGNNVLIFGTDEEDTFTAVKIFCDKFLESYLESLKGE